MISERSFMLCAHPFFSSFFYSLNHYIYICIYIIINKYSKKDQNAITFDSPSFQRDFQSFQWSGGVTLTPLYVDIYIHL